MNASWGRFSSSLGLFVIGCDLFPRPSQALICLVVLCAGVALSVVLCTGGCLVGCTVHWGSFGCAVLWCLICLVVLCSVV